MPELSTGRAKLSPEQGALIWCMRAWVRSLRCELDTDPRIQGVLGALGAPDAAPYLEGFMFAVGNGATRTIAVQCACCPAVSPDEQLLLDALGLAQEQRPFEALLRLRACLSPEGARAALRSAGGIGAALARVGCFLPAPDGEVQRFAFAGMPREHPSGMAQQ